MFDGTVNSFYPQVQNKDVFSTWTFVFNDDKQGKLPYQHSCICHISMYLTFELRSKGPKLKRKTDSGDEGLPIPAILVLTSFDP